MNATDRPAISFCTWLYEWPIIRAALPINMKTTAADPVEFILVDIGSSKRLAEWVARKDGWRRRVSSHLYELDQANPVDFSRDKNRAHRLGRGRILVNLDGDNILGPRFVRDVLREIDDRGADLVHAWSGDWGDGTCGRIAIAREAYDELGGYDESFEPVGYQDLDLVARAKAYGLRVRTLTRPEVVGLSVGNSRARKMRYIRGDFDDLNSRNAERSRQNIKAGRLVANLPKESDA